MTFSADNQPANRKSGPNIKAKIMAGLARRGMSEDEFIDKLIEMALVDGGVFMTELLKRYAPVTKQTFENITIDDWPTGGTAIEKAEKILNTMASGDMPPDLGALFIESISKSLGIEEITELAKRLEALEAIIRAKEAN